MPRRHLRPAHRRGAGDGVPEHRDNGSSNKEKASGKAMRACVFRAVSACPVLDIQRKEGWQASAGAC